MHWHTTRHLIKADLYRYYGRSDWRAFLSVYFHAPGFVYTFWMRLAALFKTCRLGKSLYLLARLQLRRLEYKYGICIPYNTDISAGLYIGHFGGIVVSHKAVIGKNCNINHGVTIGETFGGKHPGTPVIGDYVYIGPGSFIIGGIHIGNHVAIGANTVVTRSVPDYGVVVTKAVDVSVSYGSSNYIVNTLDNS